MTRKLEATQAALAEAEAFPVEATKNAKLLNAKILELQEENHQLTQTRATLEATIEAKAAEVAALHDASQTAVGTQAALQAQCDDLTSKYGALAKQHSVVLSRQEELTESWTPGALSPMPRLGPKAPWRSWRHKVEAATADNWWTSWTPSWRRRAWRRHRGECGCDDEPKNTTDADARGGGGGGGGTGGEP